MWDGVAAPKRRARRAPEEAQGAAARAALPMGDGEGATLARGAPVHGVVGGRAEERRGRSLIEAALELRGAPKGVSNLLGEVGAPRLATACARPKGFDSIQGKLGGSIQGALGAHTVWPLGASKGFAGSTPRDAPTGFDISAPSIVSAPSRSFDGARPLGRAPSDAAIAGEGAIDDWSAR
jgi:hypothetical protein